MSPENTLGLLEHAQGGPAAEEHIVLAGMESRVAAMSEELDAFHEEVVRPADQELTERLLQTALQVDPGLEELFQQRVDQAEAEHAEDQARMEAEPEFPDFPEVIAVEGRVFTGSLGATVSPSFNYEWTWERVRGGGYNIVKAEKATGKFRSFSSAGGSDGDGSAAGMSGVGIFFRPVVQNGYLIVRASPAYKADGRTYTTFCSGGCKAWLGLDVDKYEVSTNRFVGTVVQTGRTLYRFSTWWPSGSTRRLSSSGHSMSVSLSVDSAHWYAIWVWGLTTAGGGGKGFMWYGAATSRLQVTVPSISWALY